MKDLSWYPEISIGLNATIGDANTGMDWTQYGAPDNNTGTTFTITSVPTEADFKSTAIATLPFNTDLTLNETGKIEETGGIYEVAVPSTKPNEITWLNVGTNPEALNSIVFNITASTADDLATGMVYFLKGNSITAGNEVNVYYSLNGGTAVSMFVLENSDVRMVKVGDNLTTPMIGY
jgi:hypothetical protein